MFIYDLCLDGQNKVFGGEEFYFIAAVLNNIRVCCNVSALLCQTEIHVWWITLRVSPSNDWALLYSLVMRENILLFISLPDHKLHDVLFPLGRRRHNSRLLFNSKFLFAKGDASAVQLSIVCNYIVNERLQLLDKTIDRPFLSQTCYTQISIHQAV